MLEGLFETVKTNVVCIPLMSYDITHMIYSL